MTDETAIPIDPEDLAALGERILELPDEQATWVMALYQECVRARLAEAEHLASTLDATAQVQEIAQDVAQIVLDAAEWLRTLWEVGYMGGGQLPASPRTRFPQIEVEDVLKSVLLARIRSGLRPLPFPPPTRNGVPWHEIVEAEREATVDASPIDDAGTTIAFAIDGDTGWDVLAQIDPDRYRVQHRGKGPLYQLDLSNSPALLSREAPTIERTIERHERAGIQHFTLQWIEADGKERSIPLRAASPDRAEIEAQHWIAREHPERYGQVRFVLN
ncbi:MAG TPA: hypothetical protein VIS73_01835 [Rhodocyclaceae bacterium]